MSNLEKHALAEFRAAGWLNEDGAYNDEMQEMICRHVLALLDVFRSEGHSGSSAPYTVDMFKKLAMFEPLVPLTGEDWEWRDTGHGVLQNLRASRVFKDTETGDCYDIEGKVFWEWCAPYEGRESQEPYKSHYTCFESRVPVTFPYTPKTEYVWRWSEADPRQPKQTEEGFIDG